MLLDINDILPDSLSIGGTIGVILTAFFFIVRVMLRIGDKSDQRFEAEITRSTKTLTDELVQARKERDEWKDLYIKTINEQLKDRDA